MTNAGVYISLVIAIILLFISMVLSAMSSAAAAHAVNSKKDADNAYKYSTAAAVVCGLSVLVMIIAMVVYHNHVTIITEANTRLGNYITRNNPNPIV